MDEGTKRELIGAGFKLKLRDYELIINFDESRKFKILVNFFKESIDNYGNNREFTDDDIELLIQDLKDISDWRHYKELKKKLR